MNEPYGYTDPNDVIDLNDTEYTCPGCDKPQPSKPSAQDRIASALERIATALEQGNAAAWNIRPGGKP